LKNQRGVPMGVLPKGTRGWIKQIPHRTEYGRKVKPQRPTVPKAHLQTMPILAFKGRNAVEKSESKSLYGRSICLW